MKTIWKYSLEVGSNTIRMHDDAEVLCVREQDGKPCIWVLVDDDNGIVDRSFLVVGTGQEFNVLDREDYLGTAFCGPFVWHVFED